MSQHHDEPKETAIHVQVGDDIEGELNIAGRDVIVHKTNQINLPFPQTLLGRSLFGVIVGLLLSIGAIGLELPQRLGLMKPFQPAREGEVLVIVTSFTGETSGATADRIFDTLVRRLEQIDLEHVRVERLENEAPNTLREVEAIGAEYNASIVIWGRTDQYSFEPHYEVMDGGITYAVSDLGILTSDLPTFVAQIVEDTPDEYEYLTLFSLGQLAFFSGDYEQAVSLFDQALNIPLGARGVKLGITTLYLYRGASQQLAGDYEGAMSNLMYGTLADPQFVVTALGLAVDETTEELSEQIAESPDDAELYARRALTYYVSQDYDLGLRDADQAISLDPTLSSAHQTRGLIMEAMHGPEPAIADFDAAIETAPDNASAYYTRGFAYLMMNRLDEALLDHNHTLELDPTLINAYLTRGFTYNFMGNDEAAIGDFQHYLDLWPDNPFAGLIRLWISKAEEGVISP